MEWAVQIITAAVVAVAAWITGRWAQRSKRTEVETPPYAALSAEVGKIWAELGDAQRRIRDLEAHQDEDRRYIRRLLGQRPKATWPRPFPGWLDTPERVAPPGPIDNP